MKQQIVKIGSNAITIEGRLDEHTISNMVQGIAYAYSRGIISILVTSGAVALGRENLGDNTDSEIDEIQYKQMCSGAGQPILMKKYKEEFEKYGLKVAQILVTQNDFKNQKTVESLMQVLQGYLRRGIIPIINENDVLSKEELVFSDNDILAMMIGLSLKVEQVIFLSNITGLYTKHPDKGGVLVDRVNRIDETIWAMVDTDTSSGGKGGMKSKILAAEKLLKAGYSLQIADGKHEGILEMIVDGEQVGTVFVK